MNKPAVPTAINIAELGSGIRVTVTVMNRVGREQLETGLTGSTGLIATYELPLR